MYNEDMKKIRVGVARGGISSEYDVSLKTGGHVLSVLRNKLSQKYQPIDLLISRDGMWHINGIPIGKDFVGEHVDVVFNALHGEYGEDGRIQSELDHVGVPYTGSGATASEIGIHKSTTKRALKESGIKMPQHFDIHWKSNSDDIQVLAHKAHKMSPAPWIVKPLTGGSSIGVRIAKTFSDLVTALMQARDVHTDVLVEEFIIGKEATVGLVEGFRGEDLYSLLPIEIKKPKHEVWDYSAKYDGSIDEVCPGNFSKEEKEELVKATRTIHRILGLKHYSRADFIVHPRGIYILEVNTLPGFTEASLFPKALSATGISSSDFIDHIISLAVREY